MKELVFQKLPDKTRLEENKMFFNMEPRKIALTGCLVSVELQSK